MKRINIYLEPKEKKELDRLKHKYHLSYSTIADILVNNFYPIFQENNVSLIENYMNYTDGLKTSIKPRNKKYNIDQNTGKIYNNILYMYLEGNMKKFFNGFMNKEKAEKEYQKINNKVMAEFQNTYDDSWNGNQLCRFIPKFFKQNPTYTKKLLNIE